MFLQVRNFTNNHTLKAYINVAFRGAIGGKTNKTCAKQNVGVNENSTAFLYTLNKVCYRGSSLSTIFGILKKSYYEKFVLVSAT